MVILDLVRAVGALPDGGVVEVAITHPGDLELARRWAERTGNTVVNAEPTGAGSETTAHGSVLVRRGRTPDPALTLGADRMPGARLWIYTNFHCNLACDYCCVASSPRAAKRELDVEVISRLAVQAADWGVQELYLTGGEPFLRRDIAEIVGSCTSVLPTTMLTNGMLFRGLGLRTLQAMPRTGFALQISVDSATPEVHDRGGFPGAGRRHHQHTDTRCPATFPAVPGHTGYTTGRPGHPARRPAGSRRQWRPADPRDAGSGGHGD